MDKIIDFFKNYTEAKPQTWDNTGLLIPVPSKSTKIMLTIDLTPDVLDEAIERKVGIVIAYHPIIFCPLKAINDFQSKIINNVGVYCPHTTLDLKMVLFVGSKLKLELHEQGETYAIFLNKKNTFEKLIAMVKRLTGKETLRHTGDLSAVPNKIVVGVGASQSAFQTLGDCIITGEMSHHSILYFKNNKKQVILTEHTGLERIYLVKLQKDMKKEKIDCIISERDVDPVEFA